jgi:hypothetical protein
MKRSQFAILDGVRNIETVMTEIVDVPVSERREPGDVFGCHGLSPSPKGLKCRIHVDGIPEHDDVEHQSRRTKLILLTFAIPLPQFTSASVESGPPKTLPPFVEIQLRQDASSECRIIHVVQHIDRLVDAPQSDQSLLQLCHPVPLLQGSHEIAGLKKTEFQRTGQTECVIPISIGRIQIDSVACQFVEEAVIRVLVDAPEPSISHVSETTTGSQQP